MIDNEVDEVITELFDSVRNTYENNLELMRGSEFVLDYVRLLYHKFHIINSNCGLSHLDFPDWIKNKKTKINSINKKENMFSICCNIRDNSGINQKNSAKNNKNLVLK